MQSRPTAPPTGTGSPGSLLALAAFAGFLTGFAELAAIAAKMPFFGLIRRSRDALWMVPAFDAALFVLIGAALVLIARFVRLSWRSAAGILAGIGLLLVLLLFKGLHPLASAALAAGVGLQVRRLLVDSTSVGTRVVRQMLPRLTVLVCILALLTVGWRALHDWRLAVLRPSAQHSLPNVLLVILDTVRAEELSLYGYARSTTPELERFAERATVFDRAFATASWTLPSHASIFTGRWPFETEASWDQPLGQRWPTLAQVLHARGYATAVFSANDHYVTWETGLGKGFEHFDDYPVSTLTAMQSTAFGQEVYPVILPALAAALDAVPIISRVRLPLPKQHRSAGEITERFLGWLDRNSGTPFFAVLNLMDAHTPYTSSDSFRYRFRSPTVRPVSPEAWSDFPENPLSPEDVRPKQDIYDGSIALIDAELGRLFSRLGQRRLDKTIIIVTADHGDEFGEHGLVGHGHSLYRLSLQVPLIISFPGSVPEGRRITAPVCLRNLAATVLDLVGEPSVLPGRSLARFWRTELTAPDTIVASIRQWSVVPKWYPVARGDLYSIAFDGFRYIRNDGDGREELYDFRNDLLERWNLAGTPEGEALIPRYRSALMGFRAAPSIALENIDRRAR